MMMDLEKFFEEKEIPYTEWEIEHEGQTNFINSDFIIQSILKTKGDERTKIAGTLFKLDFHHAAIVPYLKFLAECLLKQGG